MAAFPLFPLLGYIDVLYTNATPQCIRYSTPLFIPNFNTGLCFLVHHCTLLCRGSLKKLNERRPHTCSPTMSVSAGNVFNLQVSVCVSSWYNVVFQTSILPGANREPLLMILPFFFGFVCPSVDMSVHQHRNLKLTC